MNNPNTINAIVKLTPELAEVCVKDRRSTTVTLLTDLEESQRERLAEDAWRVGLRAISNAYTQAEEARLAEVGATIANDVQAKLKDEADAMQRKLADILASYFNPNDGQFSERLSRFLSEDGQLGSLLNGFLGPDASVLSETLAKAIGEDSLFLRRLDPEDREGIIHLLRQDVGETIQSSRKELLRELDPHLPDTAMARFVGGLRQELKHADESRDEQVKVLTSALDANDENSLLSRLIKETETANRSLLEAVNPEVPGSALSVMKCSIEKMLAEKLGSHEELLKEQAARQDAFEREMKAVIERIDTKRSERKGNTRGGHEFQSDVEEYLDAKLEGGDYILEPVGDRTGSRKGCKKGDFVVHLSDESLEVVGRLVIEAKRDASYTMKRALDELEDAKANRDATAGLFVMAASHAPASFSRFRRIGRNVIVVWDETDSSTDIYLHAALMLALSLVKLRSDGANQGNIEALNKVSGQIDTELNRLSTMEKHNDSIRSSSDKLGDEIRKGRKFLQKIATDACDVLRALQVEVEEDAAEDKVEISLPDETPEFLRVSGDDFGPDGGDE